MITDPITEAVARAICCPGRLKCDDPDVECPKYSWENVATATAALRALYGALEREGWQVVPKKPTEKQIVYGHAAGAKADLLWDSMSHDFALRLIKSYMPAAYHAVLSAAPKPPGAG